MKWEYMVRSLDPLAVSKWEGQLTFQGEAGWELVQLLPVTAGVMVIFKRPAA